MDAYDFGQEAKRLRVGTLVRLRWIAAAGQIAALLVSHYLLSLSFAFVASVFCVAALVAFNLFLRLRFTPSTRLDDQTTTYILAFDIGQLSLLLYLTGGLANPFALLLLAPPLISAMAQNWHETAKLLAFAILAAGVLTVWRVPLMQGDAVYFDPPPIEIVGFLVAIVVSAIFVAAYGSQVAREARQLAGALAATEMMLARAQHLSQLDGLAAAAAHELGTPLATLKVVVHELSAQKEVAALCGEDLALAEQELARCRTILGQLSNVSHRSEQPFDRVEIDALLEEAAGPHRLQDIDISVEADGPEPPPLCPRNPALVYGLRNLIENAVGFASARVKADAIWSREKVVVTIADDGPGYSPAVLQRLGEPYISDRSAARRPDGEAGGGLGLGLFISKALLERTGAELRISNVAPPGHGAIATVSWPRRLFASETRLSLSDTWAVREGQDQ